jgi:hypothetical protein
MKTAINKFLFYNFCGIINMLRNIKKSIFFLSTSTFLALLSVVAIFFFSDPEIAGKLTFFFLYLSIFLALFGGFTLVGAFVRKFFSQSLFGSNLGLSLRQGLIIALLVTVSLLLSAKGLLYWWVEASLILFFVFFEIFFHLKD